ncbi:MAG: flagellar M-ring protein FliF [Planctomycetes bacterium]|nr:flagellar M-ring protein FliF [Planctomycetota bacterium]
MRPFQQLLEQLKQVWLGMSVPGRFGFVVLAAVCLAAIGGVAFWAAQPDYRVLFSGLSAEDAGAITAKLEAKKIAYRLSASGTTILVPAAQAQQAKLDLAVDGLPTGGAKGFDLLDSSPLGRTPFIEHVNYIRALQAELAKTIMQLEQVAFARVHIVRPDATPFVREQKATTASVMLRLKPGASLGRNVAAGIVALVARSVEGLDPENVAVVDTSGRVLSETRSREAGAAASTNFEYRREVEAHLATKAEEMLAQVLGSGRAVVRVTADINFKREKKTREDYDPEGRVVTKELVTNKKSPATSGARGPAGATSNLGKQTPDSGTSGPGMQEETTQSDYVVSKTIQELEEEVGNIQRLTVAAMVQLAKSDDTPGDAASSMTVEAVEEIIKRAVGFKQGRDEIKVTDVKLAGADPVAGLETEWLQNQRWESYVGIARNASLGVAALVALILGRMILKRLQPAPQPGEPSSQSAIERPGLLEQVSLQAQQDPEVVARVLTSWVDESEGRRKAAA